MVKVRNQMKSVKNIQKITKAMKMVAASKLRAIQVRTENSRGLWQPFTALLDDTPKVMFNAILENACSEQGARMSAMDNSSRNAGEKLDRLTLTYNRNPASIYHHQTDREYFWGICVGGLIAPISAATSMMKKYLSGEHTMVMPVVSFVGYCLAALIISVGQLFV
ncbi:unnamed protein product [Camellia sinensis]